MNSLKNKIQDRIDHAKERQQYWKEEKDIAKIWAGIESELTLVLRDLDEAAKQIQEFPYLKCRNVKTGDADDHCSDEHCEHYRVCNWFWRVLSVLGGNEKEAEA